MADDLEQQYSPGELEYFQSGGDASEYLDELQDSEDEAREQAEQQQPADTRRSPADFSSGNVLAENGRLMSREQRELREQVRQEQLARARTEERQFVLGKELMSLMSRRYPGATLEQIEQAIGARQVPPSQTRHQQAAT
jgi:hypothetical protein